MPKNWEQRQKKLEKRRNLDMVVTNRSIKTVLLPTINKKAQEARDKRRAKTTG